MIRKDNFKISGPIVGVDIGYDSLKVVQINHSIGGYNLIAYNQVAIPPRSMQHLEDGKKILVDALKKALYESKPHRINSKFVVTGLPESKVFTTVIEVPPMGLKEMAQAIPLQATKHIPMPIESVNVDFQPLAQNKDGNIDVLIVAAPKTLVERYAEIFTNAGLILFALETKPIANSRSLLSVHDTAPILIIDIGAEGTGLTLFDNHIIRFTTSLPQGGNIFTKSIASKLQISDIDAETLKSKYGLTGQEPKVTDAFTKDVDEIVTETTRAINYYEERTGENKKVEEIRICGGGSQTPGLVEYFAKETNKKTDIGNLLVNITPGSARKFKDQPVLRYTTSIGLAMRKGNL